MYFTWISFSSFHHVKSHGVCSFKCFYTFAAALPQRGKNEKFSTKLEIQNMEFVQILFKSVLS